MTSESKEKPSVSHLVDKPPPEKVMTFADGQQLFKELKDLLRSEMRGLATQASVPPAVVLPASNATEAPVKPQPMLSFKDLQSLPKYNGSNVDLRTWNSQIKDILKLAGHVPITTMAAVVLSGEAQTWWQQLKASEAKEGREANDLPWDELISQLKDRFVLVTSVQNARLLYRKLISENETGVKPAELVKFQQRFLQLLDIIEDTSEDQAKEDFIFCMPRYLKGHLSTLAPSLTVRQLIESCLRYNSQTSKATVAPLGEKREEKRDMMQIDALTRERSVPKPYPGVSAEEHQRRLENHLCLCCGKDDHWSPECPDKPASQGNVSGGRGRGRGGRDRGRGRR